MTWALWGEARKAAGEKSPSDGLLRIGTPEMQVELVFDLEGDRYRVIRNYHRKSRRVRLDFQVFDQDSHTYKSLVNGRSAIRRKNHGNSAHGVRYVYQFGLYLARPGG